MHRLKRWENKCIVSIRLKTLTLIIKSIPVISVSFITASNVSAACLEDCPMEIFPVV